MPDVIIRPPQQPEWIPSLYVGGDTPDDCGFTDLLGREVHHLHAWRLKVQADEPTGYECLRCWSRWYPNAKEYYYWEMDSARPSVPLVVRRRPLPVLSLSWHVLIGAIVALLVFILTGDWAPFIALWALTGTIVLLNVPLDEEVSAE